MSALTAPARVEFPRESLAGVYAICPICLAAVHPTQSTEDAHMAKSHADQRPTAKQVEAAEHHAGRFRRERDEDLARFARRYPDAA